MSILSDSLSRLGSDWEAFEPPLPSDEIAEAMALIDVPLPDGLVELYHLCNGGAGSLPFEPWYFVLDGIEEVVRLREDEHYRQCFNGFLFFGGNGGGELFGLDGAGRIFVMDPIAGEESIRIVAESFDAFAKAIGYLPPGGAPTFGEE